MDANNQRRSEEFEELESVAEKKKLEIEQAEEKRLQAKPEHREGLLDRIRNIRQQKG